MGDVVEIDPYFYGQKDGKIYSVGWRRAMSQIEITLDGSISMRNCQFNQEILATLFTMWLALVKPENMKFDE